MKKILTICGFIIFSQFSYGQNKVIGEFFLKMGMVTECRDNYSVCTNIDPAFTFQSKGDDVRLNIMYNIKNSDTDQAFPALCYIALSFLVEKPITDEKAVMQKLIDHYKEAKSSYYQVVTDYDNKTVGFKMEVLPLGKEKIVSSSCEFKSITKY